MALTDGLIALWRFNKSWGDDSGNGLNLTANGATFDTINKKLGSACMSGDGVDDQPSVGLNVNFANIGIACWFRTSNVTVDRRILEHSWDSGGVFSLWVNSISEAKCDLKMSDDTVYEKTLGTVSANTYYHALYGYDGTIMRYYLNNVEGTPLSINKTLKNSNLNLLLKGNSGAVLKLDELAIWNRLPSASEVSQLYNGGTGIEIPYPTPTGGGGIWGLIR